MCNPSEIKLRVHIQPRMVYYAARAVKPAYQVLTFSMLTSDRARIGTRATLGTKS